MAPPKGAILEKPLSWEIYYRVAATPTRSMNNTLRSDDLHVALVGKRCHGDVGIRSWSLAPAVTLKVLTFATGAH